MTVSFSCKGNVCRAAAERLFGDIHQTEVNCATKAGSASADVQETLVSGTLKTGKYDLSDLRV